jgi:hypothetical protein
LVEPIVQTTGLDTLALDVVAGEPDDIRTIPATMILNTTTSVKASAA